MGHPQLFLIMKKQENQKGGPPAWEHALRGAQSVELLSTREGVVEMSRVQVGRCAGTLGALAVILLWTGLALPSRLVPRVGLGVGLGLMTGGVLLTVTAALLDSKRWLFVVAAAVVTFVLFFMASAA
jgi:hypothetical protein